MASLLVPIGAACVGAYAWAIKRTLEETSNPIPYTERSHPTLGQEVADAASYAATAAVPFAASVAVPGIVAGTTTLRALTSPTVHNGIAAAATTLAAGASYVSTPLAPPSMPVAVANSPLGNIVSTRAALHAPNVAESVPKLIGMTRMQATTATPIVPTSALRVMAATPQSPKPKTIVIDGETYTEYPRNADGTIALPAPPDELQKRLAEPEQYAAQQRWEKQQREIERNSNPTSTANAYHVVTNTPISGHRIVKVAPKDGALTGGPSQWVASDPGPLSPGPLHPPDPLDFPSPPPPPAWQMPSKQEIYHMIDPAADAAVLGAFTAAGSLIPLPPPLGNLIGAAVGTGVIHLGKWLRARS